MYRGVNISTFIGCEKNYEDARIILFGAPFDSTTSYRPGTRFASNVIRQESWGLETYSPYQDKDLEDTVVCDCGDMELPFGNAKRAIDAIKDQVKTIIDDSKIPCMIGGEHLVTLGAIKALHEKYPDLHIIHFDAHADLREEYMGEKLSHATVMKRSYDIVGPGRIFQFGIRSGTKEEFKIDQKQVYTEKFTCHTFQDVLSLHRGKPFYITIDLDVLDPSIFPATGTPEAGGLDFITLLECIIKLADITVVGMDVNELSPPYDQTGASTAVACKIVRELLLAVDK